MKLTHLSARKFEYLSADAVYISKLAEQFSNKLKGDYLLVVGNKSPEQFRRVNLINLGLRTWGKSVWLYFWSAYIYYFFWLPLFLFKKSSANAIIFSSDQNILCLLIFWKKIFKFKYKICSDWHMLFNNWKDRFIILNSDYIIVTSNKLKGLISEKTQISADKILVVYGGVDLRHYEKRFDPMVLKRQFGLPENKILVGYIGLFKTLGMEKGLKTMIEALKYLEDDKFAVLVGGKEEEINEYVDLAKELGVIDRCVMKGRVRPEEVALHEQVMDALVIPYPDKPHFRLYGFPMKVYEYMAVGKPIIYSKLEILEEILKDVGFSFTPGEPRDLARAINYVLNPENKKEVDGKVNFALENAKEFSWEKKAEKIINFIKNK